MAMLGTFARFSKMLRYILFHNKYAWNVNINNASFE